MNSNFQVAYKKIRPSVVGIGFSDGKTTSIIGTGFIVSENGWILTNRHVLEPLIAEKEKATGIHGNAAISLFVTVPPTDDKFQAMAGVMVVGVTQISFPEPRELPPTEDSKLNELSAEQVLTPDLPDLGLCKIEPATLHPAALPLKPAVFKYPTEGLEGLPVGILGFPQGLNLPAEFSASSQLQMTPLLQTGVISGALPITGMPNPENYILDIFVNGGSSGSPLFDTEGNIVGVVYATRQRYEPVIQTDYEGNHTELENVGVRLPSALGIAVPTGRIPEEWFQTMITKETPNKAG
ncbi:MAG: serine protease [Verrucomicrobiota bacterium]